jgi:hypothetical protein
MMRSGMVINYQHRHSGHCESGATSGLLRHCGLPYLRGFQNAYSDPVTV